MFNDSFDRAAADFTFVFLRLLIARKIIYERRESVKTKTCR